MHLLIVIEAYTKSFRSSILGLEFLLKLNDYHRRYIALVLQTLNLIFESLQFGCGTLVVDKQLVYHRQIVSECSCNFSRDH